jgi:hypothetical protein
LLGGSRLRCMFTLYEIVISPPRFYFVTHSSDIAVGAAAGGGEFFVFRYIFEVPILIKPSLLCNLFYLRLLAFVVCHNAVSMPLSNFVHN